MQVETKGAAEALKIVKMGAVSSAEKRPGGTRLTCSISFTVTDMKEQYKPGEYCIVEVSGEDLTIYLP